MRHCTYLLTLLLFISIPACFAQQYPISVGGCSVSPSGVEGCDWMSSASIRGRIPLKTPPLQLFTTSYVLAPGAPVSPAEQYDCVIVPLTDAMLRNERKTPPRDFFLKQNQVFLMPRSELSVLRNVGTQNATLLVIELRPSNGPQ